MLLSAMSARLCVANRTATFFFLSVFSHSRMRAANRGWSRKIGHRQQREQRDRVAAQQPEGERPQRHRGGVEHRHPAAHMRAHPQRAGADADQRVVLAVLQRVDRVVADHPGDTPGIERGET